MPHLPPRARATLAVEVDVRAGNRQRVAQAARCGINRGIALTEDVDHHGGGRDRLGRAERGVEEAELTRVKNGRMAGFVYALDNVGGFGGVADRLNAYNVYLGDPGRITTDLGRFLRATPDDLRSAAARHLKGRPRVELTVMGRREGRGGAAAAPLDRSVAPVASAAVRFRAPVPEVRRLRCGAELWALPSREGCSPCTPRGSAPSTRAYAPQRRPAPGLRWVDQKTWRHHEVRRTAPWASRLRTRGAESERKREGGSRRSRPE